MVRTSIVLWVVVCAGCFSQPPTGSAALQAKSATLPPGDMSLKAFVLQKPSKAVAVQAKCQLSTGYFDAYYGYAETHYAFDLRGFDGTWKHGYAPKTSAQAERLYAMLKNGESAWLTVRLQRIDAQGRPLSADFGDGFALVGIVD